VSGEKILNIDDSPTVQRLIEMILTSQGYKVILASDGEAGIAMAKAEKPEVILVDFVMPKMNGFQVCKALKEDPEFSDTPIILVTSKGDKVGSKFVDVLGISEYFTKPFQPEELLSRIREVIDKRKAAAAAAAAAAKTRKVPSPKAAASSGIEGVIREIVDRALEEFVKNRLPDLIRQELDNHSPGAPSASAGIQGNLGSFRIVEVLQMLALQRQTGRLAITRPGETGSIFFREGSVVFAQVNPEGSVGIEMLLRKSCHIAEESLRYVQQIAEMTNKPIDSVLAQERLMDLKTFGECLQHHTESAVYTIMAWQEGDFVFDKAQPPVFSRSLQLKVDDLLLEGARRADEWALIQQKIPSLSLVFDAMIGNAEELTTRGLSEVDMKVFSLVDGRRTVRDIIDKSALGDFEVAKSMFILLSVNLIRRKK
jgi:CheY-like chemotaxis protein